jgi:hypothetical protein
MEPGEFIANTVAAFILAGMMFLPFVNILVGSVVGGGLGGVAGFLSGASLAVLLTAFEVWLLRREPLTVEAAAKIPAQHAQSGPFSRTIVSLTDWRQLKRGFAKGRFIWTGSYRRAA